MGVAMQDANGDTKLSTLIPEDWGNNDKYLGIAQKAAEDLLRRPNRYRDEEDKKMLKDFIEAVKARRENIANNN